MVKVARGFSFARPDSLTPTPYPRSGPEACEVPVSNKDLYIYYREGQTSLSQGMCL
ncbi:unnamed protein product, partial [Brassica napus]